MTKEAVPGDRDSDDEGIGSTVVVEGGGGDVDVAASYIKSSPRLGCRERQEVGDGERERVGESREGEHYNRPVGIDGAAVEGDRGAGEDIDAPTLPNKEGARVLVSCWKALP